MAVLHCAMDWSAVCECGISLCSVDFDNFFKISILLPWLKEFCMDSNSLIGDLPRIIPVKLGDNPHSGLGYVI